VMVLGYRSGSLDRRGLHPDALAERAPGLVIASLSAWGPSGPWAAARLRQHRAGGNRHHGRRVARWADTGAAAGPGARPRHRIPAGRGCVGSCRCPADIRGDAARASPPCTLRALAARSP
jgi:hypothetical protein